MKKQILSTLCITAASALVMTGCAPKPATSLTMDETTIPAEEEVVVTNDAPVVQEEVVVTPAEPAAPTTPAAPAEEVSDKPAFAGPRSDYPAHQFKRLLCRISGPLSRCPAYHVDVPHIFHIDQSVPALFVAVLPDAFEIVWLESAII
jgi:hypothetical protein